MYACLAVTWHLHFWQNDRDFLRATVVTRGWNGYRNKSQHRKSTLETKILPPFQQGFEPATFQSRVRRSNHWAILAPTELGDKVGHFEHSQNETSSRIDQRLGVMENAINTRLIDVEENQNVLRIDMDAMDYEFAKMTDSFEHMQKKTGDL